MIDALSVAWFEALAVPMLLPCHVCGVETRERNIHEQPRHDFHPRRFGRFTYPITPTPNANMDAMDSIFALDDEYARVGPPAGDDRAVDVGPIPLSEAPQYSPRQMRQVGFRISADAVDAALVRYGPKRSGPVMRLAVLIREHLAVAFRTPIGIPQPDDPLRPAP